MMFHKDSVLRIIPFLTSLVVLSTSFNVAIGQNPFVKTLDGYTQGTTFHISYIDSNEVEIKDTLIRLLLEFDASISTYNDSSQLSRINRNETDRLDPYILNCLEFSKQVWKSTNGAYDPTILPLLNYYGQGPRGKYFDHVGSIDSIQALIGLDLVKVKSGKLIKKKPGIRLDFNACAQGYSVDLVGRLFNSFRISNFIIEIGGEVLAHGINQDGLAWEVSIEQPTENKMSRNEIMLTIPLHNAAIATSGNYRKFIESGGQKVGHQMDPRTKTVSNSSVISASVIAKDAITADAFSTAFCVMDAEEIENFLKTNQDLQVLIIYVDENGKEKSFRTGIFDKK